MRVFPRTRSFLPFVVVGLASTLFGFSAAAQSGGAAAQSDSTRGFTVEVTPATLELAVGASAQLSAHTKDAQGQPAEAEVVFFSRNRRAVQVDREGLVQALVPGDYEIVARVSGAGRASSTIVPVHVAWPELAGIRVHGIEEPLYAGTSRRIFARAYDVTGAEREDLEVKLSVKNTAVASLDEVGTLTGMAPGDTTLHGEIGALAMVAELHVVPNPIHSLSLEPDRGRVRTGDVVHLRAQGFDSNGEPVHGVPIRLSFSAEPDDDLGPAASGQIEQDGRFVAQAPGVYRIVASSGGHSAECSVRADKREVQKAIHLVGRGEVHDTHTSDFWVWQGVDGRDYAVTGTWGANGDAHFWDVTDPTNIQRIATHRVDARTVNDVKVSADGKICVLAREGASNRKNGIVILDVTDPHTPRELSTFTDELTGGVHNVFIYDEHVYALSAGIRYDIIDIHDPTQPKRVGRFELDTPGHSIHDVWVVDGIAYSSNWGDGVVLVDVGNGVAGGSPSNPVEIGRYAYPSGWNHAAWPYKNEATGTEYVIAGDEAFPYGLYTEDSPTYARGWMHFIDFTDKSKPKEVARYQVPEAGTHNLWVEDDVLYAAYYNGGLRVVDLSGELMGNLYEQGREIGWFLPTDKDGVIPNAPMVWGPQPYKGNVFFSDWNTGLWAVKVEEEPTE